jgi:DNA-binding transcriptional LysR family regulator
MHSMNITNFDLNLLRVFDAMMAERNVTRAAHKVNLSQPAASHALARLRSEIGDPLFVRAGREMVPTPKASALGPAVHDLLDKLGAMLGHTAFDPCVSTATFRLGMIDFVEFLLAPIFSQLICKEGPNTRFVVINPDPTTVQAQLANGELDMALGIFEPTAPGIHARRLGDQSLVGLVKKGHPLSRGKPTAAQLRSAQRLATSPERTGAGGAFDRQLARAGIAGEVVYVTQNFFAVPTILIETDLLLITGQSVAQLLCSQHPLAMVDLPTSLAPLQAHLLWHERSHHDPAQKWMRDKLVAATQMLGERQRNISAAAKKKKRG